MNNHKTIADLFAPNPYQWGLRGDPHLWWEMQEHFQGAALPQSAQELEALIIREFEERTGHPISHPEPFFLEKYAHGGMSSGHIQPAFWRDSGIPLLVERWEKERMRDEG